MRNLDMFVHDLRINHVIKLFSSRSMTGEIVVLVQLNIWVED